MGYVIVIDPGHGGSSEGGIVTEYLEKDLNLSVADSMKDYLEKFDNVSVFMTRTSDVDMTIQQRLDFAKSVNADYFISIHFNMSTLHNLYGSEIWLPLQSKYYNELYPFADQIVTNFENMGFHNRGIKTRVGKAGDNYYGVLRIGSNYDIPSCIIEHCYLDNPVDAKLIKSANGSVSSSLMNFGIQDATALAKSLHLKSSSLGVDYSTFSLNEYKAKNKVLPDETEPEINEITLVSSDLPNGKITINMHAVDKQSFIQYYMYSTDGGVTFSSLKDYPRSSWNKSLDNAVITLDVPKNKPVNLVTAVINQYDKITVSNVLTVEQAIVPTPTSNSKISTASNIDTFDAYETISYDIKTDLPNTSVNDSLWYKMGIFFGTALLLLVLLALCGAKILKRINKKVKKNDKKDY